MIAMSSAPSGDFSGAFAAARLGTTSDANTLAAGADRPPTAHGTEAGCGDTDSRVNPRIVSARELRKYRATARTVLTLEKHGLRQGAKGALQGADDLEALDRVQTVMIQRLIRVEPVGRQFQRRGQDFGEIANRLRYQRIRPGSFRARKDCRADAFIPLGQASQELMELVAVALHDQNLGFA